MDNVNLSGKKILVTGGNGYLGSKLTVFLCEKGAFVFSIDLDSESNNPDVNYYQVNLLDMELLDITIAEIQPQLVFHLAANLNRTRNYNQVDELIDVNFKSTNNLLTALINVNYDNFIFASTSEVYGGAVRPPFKENDPIVPASPYSLSKYCAEKSIQTFSNIYDKNFTILRLFNFFGSDMSQGFFIPQLIYSLRNNIDFDMTEGLQIRDFIFIDEVIKAIVATVSENAYNQVFNLCSGIGVSLRVLALQIKKVLGSKAKINFGVIPYRENEIWEMVGDNTKIRETLGLEISTSFLEDIDKWIK